MHGAIKRQSKATPVHARARRSKDTTILDTLDTPAKMILAGQHKRNLRRSR